VPTSRSPALRFGVIGAGAWAVSQYLPVLASHFEVQLIGLCRLGEEPLRDVQHRFGFEVASEDYRDILAAGLDAVIVSSPAAFHHEHVAAALESGAHVLCEKPMTVSAWDAWDLVSRAEAAGKELMISFGWNYMSVVAEAKRLIEARPIGVLEHFALRMSSGVRQLLGESVPDGAPPTHEGSREIPDERTWSDSTISGGGYGQAQLTHALALAFHLTDFRAIDVYALMGREYCPGIELHIAMSLRLENGAVGTVSGGSGFGHARHEVELRAIGSDGELVVDLGNDRVTIREAKGRVHSLQLESGAGMYDSKGPIHAFVDVVSGNALNVQATGTLGAKTVELLDAAYRSSSSGRPEPVAARLGDRSSNKEDLR